MTTTSCARSPRSAAPGASCVSSHLVGERMKEMYEAARAGDTERARAIDAELADVYQTLFVAPRRRRSRRRSNMLGLRGRRRAAAAGRGRRGRAAREVRRMLEVAAARDDCGERLRLARSAGPAARRSGRDRQEHDGARVRRPDRRGRHGADVPDHRDARHRPGAAGLRVSARPRRAHRGDRADARPRGPRRRAALGAARARAGHAPADLRRPADDRDGALEDRGAQAQGRDAGGGRARRA